MSLARPAVPPPTAAAPDDRPSLAIMLVLVVMLLFVSMDTLSKLLTETAMAPEAIIAVRFGIASAVVLVMVAWRWDERPLVTRRPGLHIVRGVLQIAAGTVFIYALSYLPLETATAIGFVSPLFITALSVPILKEKVGARRWAAVLLGFGGVLMILRPGSESFQWAMLLPMVTSLFWATGIIITRFMRTSEKPLTVLAWSTWAGFAAVLPFGLASFTWPNGEQWLLLLSLTGCHLAAQTLMIRAYMMASASILAPFSYSTLVWATMAGLLIFGSVPDLMTIAGAAVLAGAGLYVWWRERRLSGSGA